MKPRFIFAILLIAISIIAQSYQGFTYTTREQTIDLGLIRVTTEETYTVPLLPILGAVALAASLVLLSMARKQIMDAANDLVSRQCRWETQQTMLL